MPSKLLLAPAAGGKTQKAIDRVCALLANAPLTPVWIVVPDRNQGAALGKRLASRGAIGVRIGTFHDLYAEILAAVGQPFPLTPEPVIHLLLRAAIDRVAESGLLTHYQPIRSRPGLVTVLAKLFAELKRARITPQDFSAKLRGRGARLQELAAVYEEYHARLVDLSWSDHEGLGWLAVEVLKGDPALATDWPLLVVDGFDSFNPSQVALLKVLEPRVGELLLTLTGDPAMSRVAYRRFAHTLEALQRDLSPECEELPPHPNGVAALAHLENRLFRLNSERISAGENIAFVEAQNTALEAREALRWLKARIVRDGLKPHECAVVARDIGLYRVSLHEAAREFGLPLHLACGEPLVANPAVAAVLNMLELPLQDWARRPLLDLLRTPYFDLSAFGPTPRDAGALDEIARASQVIKGIDQWEEALLMAAGEPDEGEEAADDLDDEAQRRPQRPTGDAARVLWQQLQALCTRLTPPAKGTLADYAQWVENLLAENGGVGLASCIAAQQDTAERDKGAVDALVKSLGALVLGEEVLGEPSDLTYPAFCAALRAVVDTATYRLDEFKNRNIGYIFAASLDDARGMSYRAVAILGLSEGLLPAPLQEDPLLSDEDRAALADDGLPLEPRLRNDQQTLFYEGVTRATEYLLLTRPYLADDGESWEPSHYWIEVIDLFDAVPQRLRPEDVRPHCDAASQAELLAWSVRRGSLHRFYGDLMPEWERLRQLRDVLRSRLEADVDDCAFGKYEGDASALEAILVEKFGPTHIWSASRLEIYAACPFQFYTTEVLGLEERKPPEPGYDAAQLGSMLHEILEGVYRDASDPSSLEALLSTLPTVAERVFRAAPRKYGFRPTPLWDTERRELLKKLERTLAALAELPSAFHPTHFELRFGIKEGAPPLAIETDGAQVLIHGVIDRVDLDDAGNFRIIDYKTGGSGLDKYQLIDGNKLQLPIYSLAAEKSLGLGKAVDGFYWRILRGDAGSLKLQSFQCEADGRTLRGADGAMELAISHIASILRGIRAGSFSPAPAKGDCKGYCPARQFCWRYHPANW